jgi:hypothetical protein
VPDRQHGEMALESRSHVAELVDRHLTRASGPDVMLGRYLKLITLARSMAAIVVLAIVACVAIAVDAPGAAPAQASPGVPCGAYRGGGILRRRRGPAGPGPFLRGGDRIGAECGDDMLGPPKAGAVDR